MKLRSIKEIKNIKGKRFLLRVDFDVPIKQSTVNNQQITEILDDTRIKMALPTIKYLLKKKARIILIAHLDRPGGKRVPRLSLRPVATKLKELLITPYQSPKKDLEVKFLDECIGERVEKEINKMKPSEILLLENLRFSPGEELNLERFAKKLASSADFYINNAFAVCHREHVSVSKITEFLPSYAGFQLEEEIKNLSKVLEKPSRPLVVIFGGAKISSKIETIKNFLFRADYLLIGGALANNFFKALKLEIGGSPYEPQKVKVAKGLLVTFKKGILGKIINEPLEKNQIEIFPPFDYKKVVELRHKVILPIDVIVKTKNQSRIQYGTKTKNYRIKNPNKVSKDELILDIGPQTINLYKRIIKGARTLIWNGPLGYFEEKPFDKGTKEIIKEVLKSRARSIIGGGETIEAWQQATSNKQKAKRIFISSGGGAMLEFLAGRDLPGVITLIKH